MAARRPGTSRRWVRVRACVRERVRVSVMVEAHANKTKQRRSWVDEGAASRHRGHPIQHGTSWGIPLDARERERGHAARVTSRPCVSVLCVGLVSLHLQAKNLTPAQERSLEFRAAKVPPKRPLSRTPQSRASHLPASSSSTLAQQSAGLASFVRLTIRSGSRATPRTKPQEFEI
jgi:hypothetical protein